MSKLICFALFLGLAAQCQAQGLWDRWNFGFTTTRYVPPITKKPTTTTTTTTTPRPTTPKATPKPASDASCKYVAGKCQPDAAGNFYRIETAPAHQQTKCPTRKVDCNDGQLLADLFTDSFLGPAAPKKAGSQGGQVDLAGRNHVIGSQKPAPPPSPTKKPCFELRNKAGVLISGGCSDESEYQVSSRRKRSVPPPFIVPTRRDVLIIMDESGSVGVSNYNKVKRIAAAIVKLLCGNIRYDQKLTRIAIMSFDEYYHFHVPLSKFYSNPDALATFIKKNIKYHSYSSRRTCMAKALRFGYQVMLSTALGGRSKLDDVEQDIILITDGCANCARGGTIRSNLETLSDEMKAQGIHVYVIGIAVGRGRDNCKQNLQVLAQGGRCYHFFYLDRWEYDVNNFLDQLEKPPGDQCLNTFEHPLGLCLPPVPAG